MYRPIKICDNLINYTIIIKKRSYSDNKRFLLDNLRMSVTGEGRWGTKVTWRNDITEFILLQLKFVFNST